MQSPEYAERMPSDQEIDLRALGQALKRRRNAIVIPTIIAFMLVAIFVNVVTPRYTAETQVLLENQETFFTRPDRVNLPPEMSQQVDQEGVASQVQLINSRDIARRAIKKLGLAGNPEFDPLAGGLNPVTRLLILLGILPDPARETAEARIVTKFLEKLVVYSPTKTRVISIQFTSRDPELAARAANTIAQLYLQEQSAAKRATAKISAEALSKEIADLRTRLAQADSAREQYRMQSGLLAGSNNMTISGQQLADINGDLSKARAAQADAQAKAEMIRQLLRDGKSANVADVINNDIVRRVSDQRFAAQAQLGREARTLLPGHPRIKELQAQLAEYDAALKSAAKQAASSLENEAKIAGQRVTNLEAALNQQKQQAGVANADEVTLRALDRQAQSLKDQLESSTAKYQEAMARQGSTATPADARIISSASQPQEPSFPKKVPYVLFGTAAALILSIGFVLATELLATRQERVPVRGADTWQEPAMSPAAHIATETKPSHEPVFETLAPRATTRPSVESLRSAASGGVLAGVVDYFKTFGRSAEATRSTELHRQGGVANADHGFGWEDDATAWTAEAVDEDAAPGSQVAPSRTAAQPASVAPLVDKIVRAHVPGRGLHVVGTCVGDEAGPEAIIELGRLLSVKGRAIVVDLNRMPFALAPLTNSGDGKAKVTTMHGLAELLSGEATFAEVIHRDQASRLHFVPTGLQEADFRDFDLILDALSETYDFIILLTPAFPQSEIAKIMAPYADFVVVATAAPDTDATAELEEELLGAGARDVLVTGSAPRRSLEVA